MSCRSRINNTLALLVALAFSLIALCQAACTVPSRSFGLDLEMDGRPVHFEQEIFTRPGKTMIGLAKRGYARTCSLRFDLKDMDGFYYAYLSIATWDVDQTDHEIILNGEFLGCIEPGAGSHHWSRTTNLPDDLAPTQMYIPKRFFRPGTNTLVVRGGYSEAYNSADAFVVGRMEMVVVRIRPGGERQAGKTKQRRYFPKQLAFFDRLTDEELYISTVAVPTLVKEMNLASGMDRKHISYVYSRIGGYYRWRGEYAMSLAYQRKALDAASRDGSPLLRPYLLAKLGLAHYYLGEYGLGMNNCRKALEQLRTIKQNKLKRLTYREREDTDYNKLVALTHLALNAYAAKDHEQARQALEQAEVLWFESHPPEEGLVRELLGKLALIRGDVETAAKLYRDALGYYRINPYINADLIVSASLGLARTLNVMGDPEQALKILDGVENPTHEFTWRAELLRGEMAVEAGRAGRAADHFARAIEDIERSRSGLGSHGFKISFMNDKQEPYARLISVLAESGDAAGSFAVAERARARAFLDLLASGSEQLGLKNQRLRELSREERQLREKILRLQNRLDNEQRLFQERGVDSESARGLQIAREELEHFHRQAAINDAEFASLRSAATLDAAQVAKMLPENTGLAAYYCGRDALYIWTLDRRGCRVQVKDVSRVRLEGLVRGYRRGLDRTRLSRGVGLEAPFYRDMPKIRAAAGQLGDILLGGALDSDSPELIYVVPHGPLHYLPFPALRHGGEYLARIRPTAILPSASVLKYLSTRGSSRGAGLLALGNPASGQGMELPFAEREVQAIKVLDPRTEVLVRDKASEAAFKAKSGGFGILHVASHGEFFPKAPLQSALRLAPGGGDDGRLETREIFGLDLDAELVALSACNTAMGGLTNGDELVGLSRAFMFAGARSILATLWNVNDRSTSRFMTSFYNHLENQGNVRAMQSAQLEMLDSADYRHPYYWAGFQIVGGYR